MSKTTAYHFTIEFPTGHVGPRHNIIVQMSYLPTEADQMEAQARATAIKKTAEASGVPAESLVARLTKTEHMPDDFDPILDFKKNMSSLMGGRVTEEFSKMVEDMTKEGGTKVTSTWTHNIQGEIAQETAQKIARIREEGVQKVTQIEAEIARAARAQGEEDRRVIRARHVKFRAKLLDWSIVASLVVFAIWFPLDGFATLAIVALVGILLARHYELWD
jgi:hypothetical protein